MSAPHDHLRGALEAFLREEATERVYRWRGSRDALSIAEVIERHDWLGTRGAREALGRAAELGALAADEVGALAAHLATFVRARELARAGASIGAGAAIGGALDAGPGLRELEVDGRRLEPGAALRELLSTADARRRAALAHAIEESFETGRRARVEAIHRADEAEAEARAISIAAARTGSLLVLPTSVAEPSDAAPPRDADAGPDDAATVSLARELLSRTDGAADEAARGAIRAAGAGPTPSWADLFAGLRAPSVADVVGRRDRWRRVATSIRALGLEEEIASRVRVEPHDALALAADVASVRVPTEVRIAEPSFELGLPTELSALDAFGRAVALALASPALPIELRHPARATFARALGALFAQLPADRVYLRRALALDRPVADRLARSSARIVLVRTRLAAALLVAHHETGSANERLDAAGELARRALGVRLPAGLVAVALAVEPAARLRGALAGLAAAVGLRDRFDEDWFANPRADEPLRSGAARGGGLSAESWCDGDLGVSAGAAVDRLIEICA